MRLFPRLDRANSAQNAGQPNVAYSPHTVLSPLVRLLLAVLLGGAAMSVAIVVLGLMNGSGLNYVSGAWTSLAMDLRNGLFYRALYDPTTGFGGTRFFPAMFVLQATLAEFGGTLVGAGQLISLGAGLLLLVGLVGVVRRLGGGWLLAGTLVVLLLCTATIQVGLQSIRGDILPLAFSLIGLTVFLTRLPRRPREILAALCFTLAFASKATAIHGPAALFLWLLVNGRVRDAARMSLYAAVGYLLFLGALVGATSGRIVGILEVSAMAGGTLRNAIYAPIALVSSITKSDPVGLLISFVAVVCLITRFKELSRSLPAALFVVSLSITVFQFTSPGIDYNHFVDLAAASLLVIGVTQITGIARANEAVWVAIALVGFAGLWNVNALRREWNRHTAGYTRYPVELVQRIAASDGPVVSENPFLPVLAGRSPFVLDPFMLRLILQSNPEVEREFLGRVERREFPLIVLSLNPLETPDWYAIVHFGTNFVEAVVRNYEIDPTVTEFVVYTPRLGAR